MPRLCRLNRLLSMVLLMAPMLVMAKPIMIHFHENSTHTLKLSKNNLNNLQVPGDYIIDVIGPEGKYSVTQPKGGGVGRIIQLSPGLKKPFTLYIVTQGGRHVSLNVQPTTMLGRTVLLMPQDGASPTKKEQSTAYSRYLMTTMRAMLQGKAPEGFGTQTVTNQKQWINRHVSIALVKRYQGDTLAGRVYVIRNASQHTMTFSPSEFYHHGIRAVAISEQTLTPGAKGLLYTLAGVGRDE